MMEMTRVFFLPFLDGPARKVLIKYNAVVYLTFAFVYTAVIDFDRHFSGVPGTPGNIAYYTLLSHTGVMCNEIVPKTPLARLLLAVHVFLSWGIFVSQLVGVRSV